MPIRSFSHVAIGVLDMDRSIRFYRDVIGLEVSFDGIEEFPANGTVAAMTRRGVYFRWGQEDGTFLVLDERERSRTTEPKQLTDTGIHHFGFWVDSVEAAFRRARENGAEVMVEPLDLDTDQYGEPGGGLIRTLVVRDPDGNVVQLDERVRMSPAHA